MSKEHFVKMKVIGLFRERKLTRKEAADRLGLTERQVTRLAARYRVSVNQKPEDLRAKAVAMG